MYCPHLQSEDAQTSLWAFVPYGKIDKISKNPDQESDAIKLQVANARPDDSGRGLARLPRSAMVRLGVTEGDVVELVGKRVTPARVVFPYAEDESLAARVAGDPVFGDWPLIILHDDAAVARSSPDFLWSTWTRFEPAADIHAAATTVERHHLVYKAPIVIDARTKPGFPDELIVRDDVRELVDRRWTEYFPRGLTTEV